MSVGPAGSIEIGDIDTSGINVTSPDASASSLSGIAGASEGTTVSDAVDLAASGSYQETTIATAPGEAPLTREEAQDLGIKTEGQTLVGDVTGEPSGSEVEAAATDAAQDAFASGGTSVDARTAASDAVDAIVPSPEDVGSVDVGSVGDVGGLDIRDVGPVSTATSEVSEAAASVGEGGQSRTLVVVAIVGAIVLAVLGRLL